MKRRTHPVQKTGVPPYTKYGKREYRHAEWVTDKRRPIPIDIQHQLDAARAAARAASRSPAAARDSRV